MKKFIKQNKQLFIGITIVILFISVLIGGFFMWQNYKYTANIKQEALDKTQQELESLKRWQAEQESKSPQVIIKETIKEIPINTNEITADELNPYLTTVLYISCDTNLDRRYRTGSGFFWKFSENDYSIITNQHVMEELVYKEGVGDFCNGIINDVDGQGLGLLRLFPNVSSLLNSGIDILSTRIWTIPSERTADQFNYKLSSLRKCQNNMPIGSPVAVIGYPVAGEQKVKYDPSYDYDHYYFERIATDGKISGYVNVDLESNEYIPVANYYVSATLDSGNSGGIALSKDKNGLCLLGVPTWLKLGEYATQGIVQNINNIFK